MAAPCAARHSVAGRAGRDGAEAASARRVAYGRDMTAPRPDQLVDAEGQPTRDRPWIFRTYAGHSSPRASNALYRANLERGQTGLSIAFDLPTQCGYSSDATVAGPEVGKVGVPVNSLDDLHVLFDGLPLERMNTSMTINGTAMWLLALYVALARERGVATAATTSARIS